MKAANLLTFTALAGVPVLAALAFAAAPHRHAAHEAQEAHAVGFTDQGVTVAMHLSGDGSKLLTTFTPQRPGFHLYSVDLPADGIQGLGRPTRVEVAGALRSRGPLIADSPVRMLSMPGTGVTFPVYPDGPVTTELAVAVDPQGGAQVLVSYAACSAQECLMPVSSHPVQLTASALADLRSR